MEPRTAENFMRLHCVCTTRAINKEDQSALDKLNHAAEMAGVERARCTEKVDGTCCLVALDKGRPELWARLDRKLNKQAEKRFRKFQLGSKPSTAFECDVDRDFRVVPDCWKPANGVQFVNGQLQPDENGHILGWVPVCSSARQYVWHNMAVAREIGKALVLRPEAGRLILSAEPLTQLLDQTLELIGTHVNNNPYGLGRPEQPLHVLVPHCAFGVTSPPQLSLSQLRSWFETPEGQVEGLVWCCANGELFKVNRHHVGLSWPLNTARLAEQPVLISVSFPTTDFVPNSIFAGLARLDKQTLPSIHHIRW
uniref:RNA ligase 1 isoform X2 n=1 Tax=Myxine glutinosa TaxID=7769 RepID=UPI00358EFB30